MSLGNEGLRVEEMGVFSPAPTISEWAGKVASRALTRVGDFISRASNRLPVSTDIIGPDLSQVGVEGVSRFLASHSESELGQEARRTVRGE